MSKEGFRPIPSLIYVITAMYILDSYLLYFGTEILPAAILPFYRVIRPFVKYMECTVIAIWIMGYAVLRIKPVYDKDYIIILGCSISKNGLLRPLIKKRVNRAIHFVWEQEIENEKTAYYVPSGGKGDDEPLSEGSAMELYLLSHGAEDFEVFPEKKSRNTEENLKFSIRSCFAPVGSVAGTVSVMFEDEVAFTADLIAEEYDYPPTPEPTATPNYVVIEETPAPTVFVLPTEAPASPSSWFWSLFRCNPNG